MSDEYVPRYNKSEILVKFRTNPSENFTRDFLEIVNKDFNKKYSFKGIWGLI